MKEVVPQREHSLRVLYRRNVPIGNAANQCLAEKYIIKNSESIVTEIEVRMTEDVRPIGANADDL
jgi:putative transposon-encoded protein